MRNYKKVEAVILLNDDAILQKFYVKVDQQTSTPPRCFTNKLHKRL